MVYILLESFVMVVLIYFLFYFLFLKLMSENDAMSSYECGFDPNSLTRLTFSYRFFLISILFIIFDVEISLMLPVPFLMMSVMGVWIFMFFILILILGLLYEYEYGSLDWLSNIMFKV